MEEWFTNLLDNIDHTNITTKIQCIAIIMPALTFIVIEITDSKFIYFYFSTVLVHHIWLYLPRIQTYCDRESLKYTPRLIGRGQWEVLMSHEPNIIFINIEYFIRICELQEHSIFISDFGQCRESIFKKLFYRARGRFNK